jgi:hypothetical protein
MVSLMVLLLVTAAPPAGGEAVDPRETEAKKACAAGQAQRGIELLADYYAESGDENAIYNQGRCYQQNDMARPALARFREFLRVAKEVSGDLRRQAESHIQELEAELLRADQAERSLAEAPPAAPGVTAPPVVVAPAPRAPSRGQRLLRSAGWVLGGVAVAAAGTGLVFTMQVRRHDGDLRNLGEGGRPAGYDDYQNTVEAGRRAQTLQWVGYGTALGAALGSAACFLLAGRGDRSLALLPAAGPSHGGATLRLGF